MSEQHAALDANLARQFGELSGRVTALERGYDRVHTDMQGMSKQLAHVQAEQAVAKESRANQHAEAMAQMEALQDTFTPLLGLPAEIAGLREAVVAANQRIDKGEEKQDGRSVSLRLPEPSLRNVIATLMFVAAVAGAVLTLLAEQP